MAVVGSGMATELQEALRYCYHEAFSELNSIAKRRPMMPGLHDVNVKMAIMDKLMSFFMVLRYIPALLAAGAVFAAFDFLRGAAYFRSPCH